MRIRFSVVTLLVVLAFAFTANAQTYDGPITGTPQFGSFTSGPDVVNLGNLNVHFEIPLYHKDGRGIPFDYKLVYDSSVWNGTASAGSGNWAPANPSSFGWTFEASGWETATGTFGGSSDPCEGSGGGYTASASGFSITTPDGVKRAFSGTTTFSSCNSQYNEVPLNVSNGGYLLHVQVTGGAAGALVAGSLTDLGGRVFTLIGLGRELSFTGFGSGGVVSDTNGNSITVARQGGGVTCSGSSSALYPYSDTLGATPLAITSASPIGNKTILTNPCAPSGLQYTDANGNPQNISITYTPYTVATYFQVASMGEYGPVNGLLTYLITGVAYPDGTGYSFGYEPTPAAADCTPNSGTTCTTGRIVSITLRNGGQISYSYIGGTNNTGVYFDGSTAGFTRTTSDGATTYARSGFSSSNGAGSSITTITSADSYHSKTAISFMESNYNFYETQRKIYSGSSTLKRTISTCYWNGSTTNCSSGTPAMPFSEIDVYQGLNDVSPSQVSETVTKYNSYQLPIELDEYDYGSSSAGPLTRQTITHYDIPGDTGPNTTLCNGTSAPNICNRQYQVTVYDGSSHQVAQTTYTYDGGTLQASVPTNPPGWTNPNNAYRGNITSVAQWINTSGGSLTTSMAYDTAGQLVSTVDPSSNTTTIGYDATYDAFPSKVTPPKPSSGVTLSASAGYDNNTGLMTWLKDANGQQTSFTYDSMLRLSTTTNPDTAVTHSTYVSASQTGAWVSPGGGAANVDTENFYDGYGRLIRVATAASSGWYLQDICYDADGRKAFESEPYAASSYTGSEVCSGAGDTYAYDGISRLSTVTHADGTVLTYGYAGRATSATDEGNGTTSAQTISQYDGLGRLAAVCEVGPTVTNSGSASPCGLDYTAGSPVGYTTSYSYSLVNHTTTTTQGVQSRVFTSDSLGRTVSTQEAESGTTSYTYSYPSTGLQVIRTRPKANQSSPSVVTTTTTQFDQVGRPLGVTYNDGLTPNIAYSYDVNPSGLSCPNGSYPVGRLTSQSTSGNTSGESYCYDNEGRVVNDFSCTGANCATSPYKYSQGFTYDLADNLLTVTDPNNTTYTYTVSPAAELTKLASSVGGTTLLNVNTIGPQGPSKATLGNGVAVGYSYDTQQRLTGTSLTGSGGTTFYTYSAMLAGNGAIKSDTDTINGNWTYGYDTNNRLSTSNKNSGAQTFSYSYDRWGNRWQQNAPQGGPVSIQTFNTANNQLTTGGFTYDAAGERIGGPEGGGTATYTYDAEGRLVGFSGPGATASYTFDADGNRVETANSSGIYDYIYNLSGQVTEVATASSGAALRENAWWSGYKAAFYTGGYTYYLHQTPLGSVRGLTDVNGNVYFYDTSDPFGDGVADYGSTDVDTLFYAGLDHDTVSGTEHAWARQYSSAEAVWLTPDLYQGSYDLNNPQSFNRYAYVLNNPLIFTDPSGLDLDGGGDGVGGMSESFTGFDGFDDMSGLDGMGGLSDGGIASDPGDGQSSQSQQGGLAPNQQGGVVPSTNMGMAAASQPAAAPGGSGNPQASQPGPSGNPDPAPPSYIPPGGSMSSGGVMGGSQHGPSINSPMLRNNSPATGKPNSTSWFPNGKGGGTSREYGPDGRAVVDIDYGHDHNGSGDPHQHVWTDGKRGKAQPMSKRVLGPPLPPPWLWIPVFKTYLIVDQLIQNARDFVPPPPPAVGPAPFPVPPLIPIMVP